nr:hypothetical protein B0A51_00876 [Rachicladosporium sp. CCFEE 5018]
MSHSKNTSLAFFTAYERDELKGHWGSRSTRLSRDSFLPFGSCQLCLLPAREPVSCPSHGHLFCRECAISNLLAQGKELKRLRKEAERRVAEDAEDRVIGDEETRLKALGVFERTQAGLNGRNGAAKAGVKRKADDSDATLSSGDAKRRASTNDRAEDQASFWIPNKIPDHQKSDMQAIRKHPVCPAAAEGAAHDFTLKSLVMVNFASEKKDASSNTATRICPACDKPLSNATKAVLAKPCGHVLCKACSDKFQRSPERSAHDVDFDAAIRCYVCQGDVTASTAKSHTEQERKKGKKGEGSGAERGLVELSCDGTGFAGGGKSNMVKKSGVAFHLTFPQSIPQPLDETGPDPTQAIALAKMCLTTAIFSYTCTHIASLDIEFPHSPSHPSLFCTFSLKTGKPRAVDISCPACRLYQSAPLAETFAAADQIVPFLRARSGPEDEAADNIVAENWKGYTALYHILQTGEMQTVQRPVEEGDEFSTLGPGEYEGMFELRPSESWPANVATSPSQLRRWTMLPSQEVSQGMIDEVEEMLEGASEANRVQAFAQVPVVMLRRWSLVSAVLERLERPGWRDWSSEHEEEIARTVAEARVGRESIIETALLRPLSGKACGKQKVRVCAEGGILTAAVYQFPATEPTRWRPHSIDVESAMSTPRRASFVPDTPLESLRIRRGDTFDTLPGTPRRASCVPDTALTPDHRGSQTSENSTPDESPPIAPPTIPEIALEACPDAPPVAYTPFIRRSIFDVAPKAASRFSKASNSDSIASTSDSVASIKHVFVDGDSVAH